MKNFLSYEGLFLLFLQERIRTPLLNAFMRFTTSLADSGILPASVCFFLLISSGCKRVGLLASLSLILESIFVNVTLKPIIRRKRPFAEYEKLTCITRIPQDYSFPSGHTACCFAVASVIYFYMPHRFGILALTVASFVGFSRMYLGVHYPSDVVGGIAIGFLTSALAEFLLSGFVLELIRSIL